MCLDFDKMRANASFRALQLLPILDILIASVLLFFGHNSKHELVDALTHVDFTESTLDLYILTIVKCVSLVFLLLILDGGKGHPGEDNLFRRPIVQIEDGNENQSISLLGNHNIRAQTNKPKLLIVAKTCSIFIFTFANLIFIILLIIYGFVKIIVHLRADSLAGLFDTLGEVFFLLFILLTVIEFGWVLWFSIAVWNGFKKFIVFWKMQKRGTELTDMEENKKSNDGLGRLIREARPEYPIILLGCIFLLIGTSTSSAGPYIVGRTIQIAISNGGGNCTGGNCEQVNLSLLNESAASLIVLFVISAIASFLRGWMITLAGQHFVARLRKKLYNKIITLDVGFFDKTKTGELTNRLSSDTQVVQDCVTANISILLRTSLQIILSLLFMFYLAPKLAAILIASVPIIAFSAVQYGRYLKRLTKKFQDKLADASAIAEESISNVRTVKCFANEPYMQIMYKKEIDESYKLGRKIAFGYGAILGTVSLLGQLAAGGVLWYGCYLIYIGEITVGLLSAFTIYALNITFNFAMLSNVYGEFMQAVGASSRIYELLDTPNDIKDGVREVNELRGNIIFRNVCFSYPTRVDAEVLKGISIDVKSGEMVALVGPSGSGKTTIINLIERFYEITNGAIMIDGINLANLNIASLRQHIGIVNQEPILFSCSIRENIEFGREGINMEDIERASKLANAHDFITEFPEQYETKVGEKGVRLSGGQKQRVALARALLTNPSLLLLDEATSALDAESEALVQIAIENAMNGRTVIVVAHRLSTVQGSNKIIVIKGGSVVEEGTHCQLLEMNGVYSELVQKQINIQKNSTDVRDNNKYDAANVSGLT